MAAGDAAGRTNLGGEFVQHPDGVHHHRGIHIQHYPGYIAVQLLVAVSGPHDSRIQTAQNHGFSQKMLQNRERAGMINRLVKCPVQGRKIRDVTGRPAMRVLFADLPLAADQGFAHCVRFAFGQHPFENRESVDVDFQDGVFFFSHGLESVGVWRSFAVQMSRLLQQIPNKVRMEQGISGGDE